ncbi:hypothetical protein WA026_010661 [Henosepilachna vigintioctopunctata]|uniref:Uncharacterized protein n=1 Tax=Henosepilachna vigintioctopunctata TaxID=420089 RepID=A0AAW1UVM1_9CUCU
MFINTNDLLPIPPNLSFNSKIPFYRILKNILICFVFLGGLYMTVDKISDHLIHNIEKSIVYKECDRDTDILGHKQFREHILNAEKLTKQTKLDENTFSLLKNDMVNMRNQLLMLWKVYIRKS